VWGIDFFQVHTAFMQRLYVFIILDIHTRRLVCARVTSTPTTEWVCRVLKGEMGFSPMPDLLIRDRDAAFTSEVFNDLFETAGVRVAVTPRKSPKANAFVERFNGSIQRECTDHFLFLNEKQVQRVLNEYKLYYNQSRCHQGIDQKVPAKRHFSLKYPDPPDPRRVNSKEFLTGLHHEYFTEAA
jgi:transposase InsO family protein